MNLAQIILLSLGLLLAGFGVRELARTARRARNRPEPPPTGRTLGWVGGLVFVALGAAMLWGVFVVGRWDQQQRQSEFEWLTPWRVGPGLVAVLGGVLLGFWWKSGPSNGQRRCPRCWHDLGGVPSAEGATMCPECGHRARRESHLFRNRRRRVLLVPGLLLVLSGSVVLYHSARRNAFKPEWLLPDTALRLIYVYNDTRPPRWATLELAERNSRNPALMGRPMLRQLRAKLERGDPLFVDQLGLVYVTKLVVSSDNPKDQITTQEFEELWVRVTSESAAARFSPDPEDAASWRSISASYDRLFRALLEREPRVPEALRSSRSLSPAMLFSAPDYPPPIAAILDDALSKPEVLDGNTSGLDIPLVSSRGDYSVLEIASARLTRDRVRLILRTASSSSSSSTSGTRGRFTTIRFTRFLSEWYSSSPELRAEIREIAATGTLQQRQLVVQTMQQGLRSGDILLDAEVIDTIADTLTPNASTPVFATAFDPEPVSDPRFLQSTLALLHSNQVDPARYLPALPEWAPDSPDYAQAVFQVARDHPDALRLEDLQRMADSEDRLVRLNLVQGLQFIEPPDLLGVRTLVENLANDPDPQVALAAQRLQQR